MSFTVFRSGGLTSLNDVWNSNAERFESDLEKLTGVNIGRTRSVFTGLNLKEVETVWVEYRSYVQQLDASVYKIILPEEVIDENIYAYNLKLYDKYFIEDIAVNGSRKRQLSFLEEYYETRVHISSWGDALFPLDDKELASYEVLLPYHIASACEWVRVNDADREAYENRKSVVLV